ncbi:MAG: 50S ribosomal protein P1 [Candidatus Aenigmarchaeota archaeon]|nr:50S ribosomal protein P1 [Candidatus Aenigmarchaeota archaeon]
MEYLYASLLLHSAGKEINEENVKKVLEAAGVQPDEAKIKALVSALEGVNIDEVIKEAALPVAAAPAAQPAAEEKKEEEEKKKEEEEAAKKAEEAAAGLGALFG